MVAVELSVLERASVLELLLLRARGLPVVLTGEGPRSPLLPYVPLEVAQRKALILVTTRPCPREVPARVLLFPRRRGRPGLTRLADLLALYEAGVSPREEPWSR